MIQTPELVSTRRSIVQVVSLQQEFLAKTVKIFFPVPVFGILMWRLTSKMESEEVIQTLNKRMGRRCGRTAALIG